LQNLSGNPAQDYIADGVTDALITSLAQIRSLRVISRTSVLRYRGTTKPLREIAGELGVDAILEGTVQPSGNQLRITTQLIRADSDTHLWARSYQRDLGDILRLEGEVASEVAHEVKAEIGAAGEHFQGIGRILPAAQDEYFLALHFQDERDDSHLVQAIRHYESAIELQPDFALAYAGLSRAWVQRGVLGDIGFRSAEAPARKAVLRALELDPKLGEAHESLAHILMFYDLAWATAEEEFRRAIEIAPSDVFAHVYYATLLETLGRFDEGIEEGKRSVALDPVSTTVNSEYGRVLYRARRYDDAIRQLQRTLELEPGSQGVRARLADVLNRIGKYHEALTLDTPPKFPSNPSTLLLAKLARDHALIGETAEARKLVKQAELRSQEKGYMSIALAHLALGDRDQAMIWLAKAFDERQYVSLIACDPQWDAVRGDPRFRTLLRRLGLPDSARK
jgi:TolB-like protein/Tfp pilus assembly protein PilF